MFHREGNDIDYYCQLRRTVSGISTLHLPASLYKTAHKEGEGVSEASFLSAINVPSPQVPCTTNQNCRAVLFCC